MNIDDAIAYLQNDEINIEEKFFTLTGYSFADSVKYSGDYWYNRIMEIAPAIEISTKSQSVTGLLALGFSFVSSKNLPAEAKAFYKKAISGSSDSREAQNGYVTLVLDNLIKYRNHPRWADFHFVPPQTLVSQAVEPESVQGKTL